MLVYSTATSKFMQHLTADLPQGVLLTGPVGVGLKTAAEAIARTHTKEVITVTPDIKGTIGIDTVRELYTLSRSKGQLTIFVIDDVTAMGHEAQNAFLKLLEEPISSVRFILTTHAPEQLLETVRSRVEEYGVAPITTAQTDELLDTLKVTDTTKRAQLQFIAGGLPAALTRYVNDDKQFATRSATVRDARSFLQGTREERLLIGARYNDRLQALNLLSDISRLIRRGIEANPQSANPSLLDVVLSAEAALKENASVRLSLTSLALSL